MREFIRLREKQLSVNLVNTQIESVRKKDIKRIGCRVYKEGYIGIAGGIGDVDEASLIQEATDNLELKIPYEETPTQNVVQEEDRREICDEQQFINNIEELTVVLQEKYPDFIFSEKAQITEVEKILENDKGTKLTFRDSVISVNLVIRKNDSTNIADTMIDYEDRKWDLQCILDRIEDMIGCFDTFVGLPEKEKIPVITEPGLFIGKIIEELEGEGVGKGSSLFKDLIGQQVFHPEFTFGQNKTQEKYLTPFFDAEGTVNTDCIYNLIENGKILTPYTDKKIAREYGFAHTGSSISEYDGLPRNGLSSWKVKPTAKRLKDVLNGELGVIAALAMGGDYTGEGDYASPVQYALLTDGEKILGRLPLVNISGNLFSMFGEDFRGMTEECVGMGEKTIVIDMKVSLA